MSALACTLMISILMISGRCSSGRSEVSVYQLMENALQASGECPPELSGIELREGESIWGLSTTQKHDTLLLGKIVLQYSEYEMDQSYDTFVYIITPNLGLCLIETRNVGINPRAVYFFDNNLAPKMKILVHEHRVNSMASLNKFKNDAFLVSESVYLPIYTVDLSRISLQDLIGVVSGIEAYQDLLEWMWYSRCNSYLVKRIVGIPD